MPATAFEESQMTEIGGIGSDSCFSIDHSYTGTEPSDPYLTKASTYNEQSSIGDPISADCSAEGGEVYFHELVEQYALKNKELLSRLETLCQRVDVMENTAPALMMFNLFKDVDSSKTDFEEFVRHMLITADKQAQINLAYKSSKSFEEVIINNSKFKAIENNGSVDSNNSLLAKLKNVECLMVEEQAMNDRLLRRKQLEVEAKTRIDNFGKNKTGLPEIIEGSSLQTISNIGKKIDVPLTSCDPECAQLADQLLAAYEDVKFCCQCSRQPVHKGLYESVNTLARVLKCAGLSEGSRKKTKLLQKMGSILPQAEISRAEEPPKLGEVPVTQQLNPIGPENTEASESKGEVLHKRSCKSIVSQLSTCECTSIVKKCWSVDSLNGPNLKDLSKKELRLGNKTPSMSKEMQLTTVSQSQKIVQISSTCENFDSNNFDAKLQKLIEEKAQKLFDEKAQEMMEKNQEKIECLVQALMSRACNHNTIESYSNIPGTPENSRFSSVVSTKYKNAVGDTNSKDLSLKISSCCCELNEKHPGSQPCDCEYHQQIIAEQAERLLDQRKKFENDKEARWEAEAKSLLENICKPIVAPNQPSAVSEAEVRPSENICNIPASLPPVTVQYLVSETPQNRTKLKKEQQLQEPKYGGTRGLLDTSTDEHYYHHERNPTPCTSAEIREPSRRKSKEFSDPSQNSHYYQPRRASTEVREPKYVGTKSRGLLDISNDEHYYHHERNPTPCTSTEIREPNRRQSSLLLAASNNSHSYKPERKVASRISVEVRDLNYSGTKARALLDPPNDERYYHHERNPTPCASIVREITEDEISSRSKPSIKKSCGCDVIDLGYKKPESSMTEGQISIPSITPIRKSCGCILGKSNKNSENLHSDAAYKQPEKAPDTESPKQRVSFEQLGNSSVTEPSKQSANVGDNASSGGNPTAPENNFDKIIQGQSGNYPTTFCNSPSISVSYGFSGISMDHANDWDKLLPKSPENFEVKFCNSPPVLEEFDELQWKSGEKYRCSSPPLLKQYENINAWNSSATCTAVRDVKYITMSEASLCSCCAKRSTDISICSCTPSNVNTSTEAKPSVHPNNMFIEMITKVKYN